MLLALFLLLSQATFADVFLGKDVYDALKTLNLSQKTQDNIIESIYEGAYGMSSGDDGKECPTEVLRLKILSHTTNELTFSYMPTQDYVSTYGCMSIPALCYMSVSLKNGNYETTNQCEYQF